jgi:replicative DNA helicase
MAKNEVTDCFEMVDIMSSSASTSLEGTTNGAIRSLAQLREEFEELFRLTIASKGIKGVGPNLRDIDFLLGGFQKSKVYLIAARPAMGKTAFGLYLIYRFAVLKIRCLVFSMEMPAREVFARLVCIELGLTGQQVNRGIREINDDGLVMMTKEDIEYYLSLISKSPVLNSDWVHIDDTASLDINDQKSKVHVHKNQYPDLHVVMDDYIGLKRDRTSKGNRENEMSSISMKGKQLAKDADVVLISLAQLNRSVETRGGDKRPQLSDLRDSGSLEQDADVVMFLYRPEYYNIEQDEDGKDVRNKTEVIISKHRGGSTGSVWLTSYMSTYRYYNSDYSENSIIDIDHKVVEPKEIKGIQDVLKEANINGLSNFEHPF